MRPACADRGCQPEGKWYALTGRVVDAKVEADGDIHLALQDSALLQSSRATNLRLWCLPVLSFAAIASSLRSISRISARSSSVGNGILAMFTLTPAGWFHPCSCAALLTTSFSLAETLTTSSPSRSARLTLA